LGAERKLGNIESRFSTVMSRNGWGWVGGTANLSRVCGRQTGLAICVRKVRMRDIQPASTSTNQKVCPRGSPYRHHVNRSHANERCSAMPSAAYLSVNMIALRIRLFAPVFSVDRRSAWCRCCESSSDVLDTHSPSLLPSSVPGPCFRPPGSCPENRRPGRAVAGSWDPGGEWGCGCLGEFTQWGWGL